MGVFPSLAYPFYYPGRPSRPEVTARHVTRLPPGWTNAPAPPHTAPRGRAGWPATWAATQPSHRHRGACPPNAPKNANNSYTKYLFIPAPSTSHQRERAME